MLLVGFPVKPNAHFSGLLCARRRLWAEDWNGPAALSPAGATGRAPQPAPRSPGLAPAACPRRSVPPAVLCPAWPCPNRLATPAAQAGRPRRCPSQRRCGPPGRRPASPRRDSRPGYWRRCHTVGESLNPLPRRRQFPGHVSGVAE